MVSNAGVLSRVGFPNMLTQLRQYILRWLGHVRRMAIGRIRKYIRCGELASGRRTTVRPHLQYKDVCMRVRGMKAVDIDTMPWDGIYIVADRTKWRGPTLKHISRQYTAAADTRGRRKERSNSISPCMVISDLRKPLQLTRIYVGPSY